MTRTAWIAILLLLGTNAAWVVAWLGDARSSGEPAVETAALEETIADLRDEVAQLRSKGPAARASDGDAGVPTPGEAFGIESDGPELVAGGRRPDPAAERGETERLTAEEREAAEKARAEAKLAQAAALEKAKAILEKIMQIKDPAMRAEGMRELEAALTGTDAILTEYALGALWATRDLQIDRSDFRSVVLDLLDSEHAGIRRSALYALRTTGVQEGDIRLALTAATDEDPVVRQHAARILRAYTGGTFEGEAGEALAALLGDENPNVRKGSVRGLWGARVTPGVESQLIEIAASRTAERYDAVYHGLSNLADKSRDVVDALFIYLEDDNHQLRARAHWGLQRNVRKEVQPYVAQRYVEHLENFLNPKSHGEALKVIARHGDASLAPQLDRFADNDMLDERVREWARKVADHLRTK